jgi:hydroxyacylglutathione hydrolase
LPAQLETFVLDRARPVAVVCGTGYRSSIATSLLKQRGFASVLNTLGGMTAWQTASLPLERPEPEVTNNAHR